LVIGCTILGKENASYSNSTFKLEVELMEDGMVLLVVVVLVLVVDWQLLTMAKRSQSSAIIYI
jgi:hypothetical protein